MSFTSFDSLPAVLDAFDVRRAAEIQARSVCEQLINDDGSSMVSDKARLAAALPLIVGTLANRMSHSELVEVLKRLADQVEREGIVIQHSRAMSLD